MTPLVKIANISHLLFVITSDLIVNFFFELFSNTMMIDASRGEIQLDDLFNAIEHDKDQV
jgi:hypothetical protein